MLVAVVAVDVIMVLAVVVEDIYVYQLQMFVDHFQYQLVEAERELLQELQLEEHLEQIQLLYVKHLQAVAVAVQGELGFNLEQLVDLVVEAHVVVLVDLEQLVKEMMVVMELLDQQEHLIMEQAAVVELAQSDQMEHRLKVAMVVRDQVHLH